MEPIFHNKIWGGRRLEEVYGYELPEGPVGECWAISAHPNGDCVVRGGAFDGWHLFGLCRDHRELFGNEQGEVFPLLVKILDALDDLSIQVRPDDAYAREHENGALGKRECWYVLDAHEGARILVGQHAKDAEEFRRMDDEGRWHEIVSELKTWPGDFFLVELGTLHAILGSTLMLETQQSSDVTRRVYGFDRRQPDGSLREPHMRQALEVIDFEARAPVSGEVTAPEVDGVIELVRCPNYTVDRIRVARDAPVSYVQDHSFLCVSVVEGAGSVTATGTVYELPLGTHLIMSAGMGALSFEGEMTLIMSHVWGRQDQVVRSPPLPVSLARVGRARLGERLRARDAPVASRATCVIQTLGARGPAPSGTWSRPSQRCRAPAGTLPRACAVWSASGTSKGPRLTARPLAGVYGVPVPVPLMRRLCRAGGAGGTRRGLRRLRRGPRAA